MSTDVQILARAVVASMKAEAQEGGQPGYRGDGEWDFITIGVALSPEAVNAAFRIVGEELRPVISRGTCATCANSDANGKSYGWWSRPCVTCVHPLMSNWEPKR